MADESVWEDLERAIEACLEETGEPGLLIDWVVVTHKTLPEADGSNSNSTTYIGSEHQPRYRTLGLLDYARTAVIKEIHADMEGDS